MQETAPGSSRRRPACTRPTHRRGAALPGTGPSSVQGAASSGGCGCVPSSGVPSTFDGGNISDYGQRNGSGGSPAGAPLQPNGSRADQRPERSVPWPRPANGRVESAVGDRARRQGGTGVASPARVGLGLYESHVAVSWATTPDQGRGES